MLRMLLRAALLCGVLLLTLSPAGASRLGAQDASPATTGEDLNAEMLFQASIEGAPISPAFVRLIRIVLEPGASVPTHLHPGPEYNLVESGTLTVTTDGRALIFDGESDAPSEAPAGEPFDVTAGQTVVFLPETTFSFQNSADEPVQLLTAVLHPAGPQRPPGISYPEGDPPPDAYEGVANQVLGDGVASSMPADPVTVRVDRVTLEAGQTLPRTESPVLLSLDDAGLSILVSGGKVQISRTARPGPQAASDVGEAYRLGSGDAMFFPEGHTEIRRGEQQAPVTFMRLTLMGDSPADPAPTGTPDAAEDIGSIEIRGGTGTTPQQPAEGEESPEATAEGEPAETPESPDETPQSEPETATGVIPVGSTVVTNDDEINLRESPSLEAEISAVIDQGTTLVVISEPVEAEGFTWYEVQSLDDPNLRGFMAGDFLDIV